MAYSKIQEFDTKEIRIAQLAKAMGHPARIAILNYLAPNNTCICGDVVSELPLSQSTVSQHLKELKQVGLIKGNVDGPRVCYCIDRKVYEEAKREFNLLFDHLINCC